MSLSKSKSTEDSNSRKRILISQDANERADLVKPLLDDANTGQSYHSKQYVACHKCVKEGFKSARQILIQRFKLFLLVSVAY